MANKLFLLDGMALVYRGHFALIGRPIFTSKGVNTSALYVFTQTLLEVLKNQQPTHIAVAFDTSAPTQRHAEFTEYKAQRQTMPEDITLALPHVRRTIEAFRIPILTCDGYEADDIIGTVVRKAEPAGFESYMVSPDKDLGQLVTEHTFLYRPSRMGDAPELFGLPEIRQRWSIKDPDQVVDVIALWGDTSDNIPGVPGIGEKTAIKLISQYGTVENVLTHLDELPPKLKEKLQVNREQALLSKRLATINCQVPCPFDLDSLRLHPWDEPALKQIFVEFEFNSIGQRIFGEDFRAGRGVPTSNPAGVAAPRTHRAEVLNESETATPAVPASSAVTQNLASTPHRYLVAASASQRTEVARALSRAGTFSFHLPASAEPARQTAFMGVAFSCEDHAGWFVPPEPGLSPVQLLEPFRAVLEDESIEKVGHDLKFLLGVLRWHGIEVRGTLFDVRLAHSLLEPDMRHRLDYLAQNLLHYDLVPDNQASQTPELTGFADPGSPLAESTVERADIARQLRAVLEPLLKDKAQERVFYEIESPLIPVLMEMEHEGIRLDSNALADFAQQLSREMDEQEKTICRMADRQFNLNSPRQLGEVLFDILKICEQPKKTRTGQYATDEQTLLAMAPDHEIVRRLLEYRAAAKLKSTYADALPLAVWPKTGRVHTTYNQTATTTGRLNSQDPNLQNIPIRTERGQEIRKAFVPRGPDYLLLSADYSQIELRVIAALSHEQGLLEALRSGVDVHAATAARVFGVVLDSVTPEMRRQAKMVNYGIAYGISAFGLSQRLGIPRKQAAEIIDHYFQQFPAIRRYMEQTIAFAREMGYVQTVTGRRRYIRDIRSSNFTLRSAAERNAINAPIQGTAADLIKLAMIRIHAELRRRHLKTRMLLQVHDELVFDLYQPEEEEVREFVEHHMKTAMTLDAPIEVEMGVGANWLEAH